MHRADRLPKIPHSAIVRAPGLLPMLYKITEVSEELRVSEDRVRQWISQDLPVERDAQEHTWVDGEALQQWIRALQQTRAARKLGKGLAFCFRCDETVAFQPLTVSRNGHHLLESGFCPKCGTTLHRGAKYADQSK